MSSTQEGKLQTTKPVAIDLFCGRGGWTNGLKQAGFHVVGVDLDPQPDYRGGVFLQTDIRTLRGAILPKATVVVASPPCTEFSLAGLWADPERPNPIGFELLAHAMRVIGEVNPRFWAVENVQGAVKPWRHVLGNPVVRKKSWYLWGKFPRFSTPGLGNKGWDKRGYAQRGPRDPALRSEVPAELAGPFARACMGALRSSLVVEEGVVA